MADAQSVIIGARAAHVRELKAEIERLREDNAALREEVQSLQAHLDLALLVLTELKRGEDIELWDGWNLILGSTHKAEGREELIRQAEETGKRIWIIFDGPKATTRQTGKVRVTYTGGTGAHRADKYICDVIRAARYLGVADRLTVLTYDKDFLKQVKALKA